MRRRCTRGPRALRRAARGRRYGWSWWATLNRRATPPPASWPPPRGAQHPPSGAHRPKGRAGSSALRPTTRGAPRRKVNGVAAPTGDQRESSALQAMSDAVLAIAAELSVEAVLQRLVAAARELAGARYAALGVPDGEGAFEQFITSGMSDELVAAMGPLPRTHGLLGAMLESERPYRTLEVPRALPPARLPPGSALPRLVAARAPADALVPRRPDRRPWRDHRRLLPDREGRGRRVRRRGPAAHRDARRPRRDRDRERPLYERSRELT